jgi:FAD/FMN-containing dehydrogenase
MVEEEAEAAVARVVAERTRMGTVAAEAWAEEARAMAARAARKAAREAASSAKWAVRVAAAAEGSRAWAKREEMAAAARTASIANLDILHRQQMLGTWLEHINRAAIREQISKASVIAEKDEVKKHMGSMLGDWDKAGKLSKRRIRKTKTKTKRRRRRRHKNTKRRRK